MKQQNQQTVDRSLPPIWLNRVSYWFRIGLTIFIALTMLLGTAACTAENKDSVSSIVWQNAAQITPTEVLVKIVQSHSNLPEPEKAIASMKVMQVNGKQGQLALYDFNNSRLCGAIGCLYTGYLIPNDRSQLATEVFTAYLNPNVTPKAALFQVKNSSQADANLPCLLVNQTVIEGRRQLDFCYNGLSYELAGDLLFKEGEKEGKGKGEGGEN
ncbi:MAG: hypothetical protein MUE44_10735 [Oscillatoriaceae cyanobacterium Prado104]|jgi:hypothetical protein|nr:hypothetical protein [Oscillatoriaceae cyanobacterium Prado104]